MTGCSGAARNIRRCYQLVGGGAARRGGGATKQSWHGVDGCQQFEVGGGGGGAITGALLMGDRDEKEEKEEDEPMWTTDLVIFSHGGKFKDKPVHPRFRSTDALGELSTLSFTDKLVFHFVCTSVDFRKKNSSMKLILG
jgi:hypothetical protein